MANEGGQQRLACGIVDVPELVVSRVSACEEFLKSATHRYPAIVADLATIPIARTDFWESQEMVLGFTAAPDQAKFNGAEPYHRLSAAVARWAASHRITSPWVEHTALYTLHAWVISPARRGSWAFPGVTWHRPPTRLRDPRPDPMAGTVDDAAASTREWFHARTAELRQHGFVLAPRRDRTHFDWLAMHTVGGLSMSAVARAVYKDRSTVSQAVRGLAWLLHMPLGARPRRGGPVKNAPL